MKSAQKGLPKFKDLIEKHMDVISTLKQAIRI